MMTASTAILPKRMPEIVKRFLFLDVFPLAGLVTVGVADFARNTSH